MSCQFRFIGGPWSFQGWTGVQEMRQLNLESFSGPGGRAKGGEVGVHDLAIHRAKAFHGEPPNEMDKGHLGRIGGCGEHALPKNMRPRDTPYNPPTNSSPFHASTEWASPNA